MVYIYIWITIKNWRIYFEYVWILNMGALTNPAWGQAGAKQTGSTDIRSSILLAVLHRQKDNHHLQARRDSWKRWHPLKTEKRRPSWPNRSYADKPNPSICLMGPTIILYTSAPFPPNGGLTTGKIKKAQLSTGIIAVRMQQRRNPSCAPAPFPMDTNLLMRVLSKVSI